MIRAKIDECIRLTDTILINHYCGRHELLVKHLHRNCLWIGSNANEYHYGRDMVCSMLSQQKEEVPEITLYSKSFDCAYHERNSCAIVGRYIGAIGGEEKETFRDMQRVTFLWREEKGEMFLCHVHMSNPLMLVEDSEVFPHQASIQTKEYVDKSGNLIIKGEHNTLHKIALSKIIYIEAFDKNAIIHTEDGDVFAKALLAEIEKQIDTIGTNGIIRVHRSYMVNKYFVNAIKRYELEVAKKFIVPISRSRYLQIRNTLFVSEHKDISK